MNISMIIMEEKNGAIDTGNSSCCTYYIIRISSSPYTLQSYLIIDGQFISFVEIVYEGNYLFPVNIDSHYYILQK